MLVVFIRLSLKVALMFYEDASKAKLSSILPMKAEAREL